MILNDKGNRKPKEEKKPTFGNSTAEEIEARVKARFVKPESGLEFTKSMGCDCSIRLPDDVEKDTKQESWFFENPANHDEECMFIFIMSL